MIALAIFGMGLGLGAGYTVILGAGAFGGAAWLGSTNDANAPTKDPAIG